MNLTKPLDRRTFLRASGVALALPMLESMSPRLAHAAAAGPRRMVNICNTLGLYGEAWFPKTAGAAWETTEYLSLLEKHRDNFTLFTGFSHEEQTGRQPHNSEITFLTAARRPGLDGFRNTISMDQVAANHLGYTTRFPSIVLGTAAPQSQSYTRSGAMVPAETSPANLFRQLFLQGTPEEVEREKQSLNDGGSILDRLKSQTSALRRRVSMADQVKLDSYFDAVRTAELDLAEVKAWQQKPKPVVDAEPPVDIPSRNDLIGRIKLMFRMIPLILETDSSRVISLMIQDHGVVIDVPGVNFDQHSLPIMGRIRRRSLSSRRSRPRSSRASTICWSIWASAATATVRFSTRRWSCSAATWATRTRTSRRTCRSCSPAAASATASTSSTKAGTTRRFAICT